MKGSRFILGKEVDLFEKEFASYCGATHCVGVGSGTEALHLALSALGIGPGDEVIAPANTFVATAFAISYTGAEPVLVDVSPSDFNMDTRYFEQAITNRTKAVVPVHLYGQPADMGPIMELSRRHGFKVVEDACQAHGAMLKQRRVGTFGDAGCFSFYPGKNLGAYGDGGAVVTYDAVLADKIRLLRQYGQRSKYVHEMIGYNSRLDTIQAAILRVKLPHLDRWNRMRREAAGAYKELLGRTRVVLPTEKTNVGHAYHLYVIQHHDRDRLLAHMAEQGIGCGIHYPVPVHEQEPYRYARTVPDGAPVAAELSRKILSLPLYPEITIEQMRRVADEIISFDRRGKDTSSLITTEIAPKQRSAEAQSQVE
jgi:dTDP-4-amino-4,6-dideoxygalactose transaminase